MGPESNVRSVLSGMATLAGCALFRVRAVRSLGNANLLGAVLFLALFVPVLYPRDDSVQRVLIHPATPVARVSLHSRTLARRPTADFSSPTMVTAGSPVQLHGTGSSSGMDQPTERDTRFHTAVMIHSPPGFFLDWS